MSELFTKILEIVPQIVITARLVVAMTPTPKDDNIYTKVIEFFKFLGLFSEKIK